MGWTSFDGIDVPKWRCCAVVRLGWALAYRPGVDPFPPPEYEREEAEARAAGRGMWRGTFTAPWEWRHR